MKYRPDNSFGIDERRINEEMTLTSAHKKAQELFDKYAIDPETFSDLYSGDVIERDKTEVKKRKDEWSEKNSDQEKKAKILSDILEAIIFDQGEMSEWFGPAGTIKTAEFDDFVNGVDIILEFEEAKRRKSHLALAIDATYQSFVDEKTKRIKHFIKKGQMTKVKYFASDNANFRGEYSQIPLTVVSAEARTVKELAELWTSGHKEEREQIANHWIQFQMLEQIIYQCNFFRDFAGRQKQTRIADTYDHLGEIIENILTQRHEAVEDSGKRDLNLSNLKLSLSNTA